MYGFTAFSLPPSKIGFQKPIFATSAQGISSTSQIKDLGSHLPRQREARGAVHFRKRSRQREARDRADVKGFSSPVNPPAGDNNFKIRNTSISFCNLDKLRASPTVEGEAQNLMDIHRSSAVGRCYSGTRSSGLRTPITT